LLKLAGLNIFLKRKKEKRKKRLGPAQGAYEASRDN
jgi:hypothetical protein